MKNSVSLIGRVGKDPEVKTLDSGRKVANLSLATSKKYKTDDGVKEQTEWHTLTFWGKAAENVATIVKKGDLLSVEGEINYSSYEKGGVTVQKTVITVHQFIKLA